MRQLYASNEIKFNVNTMNINFKSKENRQNKIDCEIFPSKMQM